ncbi:hypothetical protein NVP1170O_118 [Vibrio phage 1.170.O._10N.261.52.C3]|nr:hypothetical protein NVP1170O_118 [Vibrio phage 1.170.O._10N.261.52.C3]
MEVIVMSQGEEYLKLVYDKEDCNTFWDNLLELKLPDEDATIEIVTDCRENMSLLTGSHFYDTRVYNSVQEVENYYNRFDFSRRPYLPTSVNVQGKYHSLGLCLTKDRLVRVILDYEVHPSYLKGVIETLGDVIGYEWVTKDTRFLPKYVKYSFLYLDNQFRKESELRLKPKGYKIT